METATSPMVDRGDSESVDRDISFVQRFMRDTTFLLTALPWALVVFTVAAMGLSMSIGLLPLAFIGLPLGFAVAHWIRWLADVERRRLSWWGMTLSPVEYRPIAETSWRRFILPFVDPQWRRDIVYSLVAMPFTAMTWSLTVLLWSLPIGFLIGVPIMLAIDPSVVSINLMFFSTTEPWIAGLISAVMGLVVFAALPFLQRGLASAQARLFASLLGHRVGA